MVPIDEHQLSLIANYQAKKKPRNSLINAAVAIVLRNTSKGPEFLLMQRAKHENDPWSGQMSFPGGKYEPFDQDYKNTAIRETKEEVGLLLNDDDLVGQIDDVYGVKANGALSVHVACYVFKVDRDIELQANHEVADLVWLPLSFLQSPENSFDFYHPSDVSIKMPAIMINDEKEQILWGLSLRMLYTLYSVLGLPMNAFSADDKAKLASVN